MYVGDFAADLPLYSSICVSAKNVLEVGCGTGRVLKHLLSAGHSVVGIDISAKMLDVAGKKLVGYLQNGTLQLQKHDFRDTPVAEQYDRILVTFYTFNYLLTKTDQTSFLCNLRKSLAPNGILLLDLFYPQPLAQPETANRWQESALKPDEYRVLLRQKRRMVGQIEERNQIYTEGSHQEEIVTERCYINKQEATALLKNAGFTNIRIANGYDESELQTPAPGETMDSAFICVATKST